MFAKAILAMASTLYNKFVFVSFHFQWLASLKMVAHPSAMAP